MSAVLERGNMMRAYERVLRNKGAPGVDGMAVGELKAHLKVHWPEIKEQLLEGRYQPLPVRKVEIPKPGGGQRMLGIPSAQDRLIQQALHQILSPLFEETFSTHSYGFRAGRSAAQAVQQARSYIEEGRRWVVDADLEKFFDRVNHDILMSRLARKVEDKRILKLIRSYLQAGIMEGGITTARTEGTPQGGPLSPLLSNILLTDLDRELERRGHRFCRYADDCNIYVRSQRAGERVLVSMTHFLESRLKLRVNRDKSGVDRPWKRSFLGYTVCSRKYNVRLKVAPKSIQRLKGNLKALFRAARGRSIRRTLAELAPKLRGWANYFRHAGVKGVFEELDGWIRRHLRKILWRQWKRPLTRARKLMRLGLSEVRAWTSATNGRGPWWNSGASHLNQALTKKRFDRLGLVSLMDQFHRLKCVV
ncbi:MAG: group II intron reverse transcriptase/maturase [Sedimenticola sp.]|nr:MAG: group II intron reverse transcriptase/maturase [Sedimenticola sp.]